MLSQTILNDHSFLSQSQHGLNKTKTVRVPSSEHVAEIVGRQGCKIKALRAKTNTYIKTPVRGSDPTFLITGRNEDVESAANEIESAAAHFSNIRANKRINGEGQVIGYVRVPYKVVGLIVGQRGTTIKKIQEETGTYIVTPSRDKDPIFEITGLIEDVSTAYDEIKTHVRIRTGNGEDDPSDLITLNVCEVEPSDHEDVKHSPPEAAHIVSEPPVLPSQYDSCCGVNYDAGLPSYSDELCNRFGSSLSFSGYPPLDRRMVRPMGGTYNRFPSWNNVMKQNYEFYPQSPNFYMNSYLQADFDPNVVLPNFPRWKSFEEN